MTPDVRKAVALTYEEAEKLALQAIHGADGRGMIGRGRNHLHQRVARAILQAHRAALPALSVPEGWVAVPREVVEPFARAADWEERCIDPDYGIARVRPLKDSRRVAVTLGECRAVRAALSAIPSPGGEGSSRPWPIDGAGNLPAAVASGDAGGAATPSDWHCRSCGAPFKSAGGKIVGGACPNGRPTCPLEPASTASEEC